MNISHESCGQVVVGFSPLRTDRLHTLQTSATLTDDSWHNVPGQGPRPGNGGADQMIAAPPSGSTVFYRVKVSLLD